MQMKISDEDTNSKLTDKANCAIQNVSTPKKLSSYKKLFCHTKVSGHKNPTHSSVDHPHSHEKIVSGDWVGCQKGMTDTR